eukprot:TRINITY_DN10277_c0_g1_i1.p2 TRINITY_DN10277_c0_g1~~TRINITY_DN10277_c0_g1_i1.p2  ORF type:complete len:56 (-),score=1.56 TRINITY_DN10277_c0_g1_i1:266-433(-)
MKVMEERLAGQGWEWYEWGVCTCNVASTCEEPDVRLGCGTGEAHVISSQKAHLKG